MEQEVNQRFQGVSMASKHDFTVDEWSRLQEGLTGTTLLVSLSDPGLFDTFKEAGAAGHHLAGATRGTDSGLVRELAGSPAFGFGLGKQPQEIELMTLAALRSAIAALTAKAPAEVEAYRKLVLAIAQSVAAAAKGVSGTEADAIEKIRSALGTAAPLEESSD